MGLYHISKINQYFEKSLKKLSLSPSNNMHLICISTSGTSFSLRTWWKQMIIHSLGKGLLYPLCTSKGSEQKQILAQSLFLLLRWIELSCEESCLLERCILALAAFQIYVILSMSILANVILLLQTYHLKPSFDEL